MRVKYLPVALLGLTLAACGSDDDGKTPGQDGEKCSSAEYVAFDPVNHQPQDARLAAIGDMLALFAAAQADPTLATSNAAQILAIYESADTALRTKVQGRTDPHFTDDAAMVGAEIDATILGAIGDLGTASTALEVQLAKQTFEKAGVYRFLYLSVMYELYAPSAKHYDEAYGYFGSGETNTAAGRRGLASLATKRDGNNGTTLADEIFSLIVDGRCAIAEALAEAGSDTFEMGTAPAYDAIVDQIDGRLQQVMAYSIGHELLELKDLAGDADEATIKLFEADGFFRVVEPYLATGDAAEIAFATEFRTALDAALVKHEAGDASWIADLDADFVTESLGALEAIYGITIKG